MQRRHNLDIKIDVEVIVTIGILDRYRIYTLV